VVAGQRREFDCRRRIGIDPAQVLDLGLNCGVFIAAAPEDLGENFGVRLVCGEGGETAKRLDLTHQANAKFFFDFPDNGFSPGLVGFELAAGLHEGGGAALTDKGDHAVLPLDDAGGDVEAVGGTETWRVFVGRHRDYLFRADKRCSMKISARNQLKGKVVEVTKGATTAHVKLDIGGSIVTASITNQAVDELQLEVGKEAYAVVKASDVMIAVD
jgi:molybdopterin-binding protein